MIKFSGDLRRDFDKATADILKLKDRILGYQEQVSKLRETEKHLRKTNARVILIPLRKSSLNHSND